MMIGVIADDLTGAAEIGGIGIRHGYDVAILNSTVKKVDSEILIIATNTRSLNPFEAGQIIESTTRDLLALRPDFIYKKLDSALRGNVGEELLVQLKVSKKLRALIIPSNPALGRTIEEGIYYVKGVPLDEYSSSGSFGGGVRSSEVKYLISKETRSSMTVVSKADSLPAEGLIVGNTANEEDLRNWVQKIDERTIPAGSSGFFDAILQDKIKHKDQAQPPTHFGKKAVYVCGSAFIPSRKLVQKAKESGQKVIYMPENIFDLSEDYARNASQWADEIVREVSYGEKVILAVDEISSKRNENIGMIIKETFSQVLLKVVNEAEIEELVIEGGATAYSIIQRLGYNKFYPVQELSPGVIRMKIEENNNIHLTLKPGSYLWPKSIWQY